LSQDKFWEQWGGSAGPAGATDPEGTPPAAAAEPEKPGGVDADVLSAWLQSLPPNDPVVPQPVERPAQAEKPAEPAVWPPPQPVDPFAGVAASAGVNASDWDLAFDDEVVPAVPAAPVAAAPPTSGAGLGDFSVGASAGPVPAANPFAPAPAPEAAAPPPMPFGPPPPPAPPSPEVLEAPPLKLVITTGRRTVEQTVQGEALIGRPEPTRGLHPEIDLRLDDAVSRRHAKIFRREGRYVLTDLNSTNGTRYNREWLQPEVEVTLKAGDEIEVGEITLIRVVEAPDPNA
jgi:hypothetical protein